MRRLAWLAIVIAGCPGPAQNQRTGANGTRTATTTTTTTGTGTGTGTRTTTTTDPGAKAGPVAGAGPEAGTGTGTAAPDGGTGPVVIVRPQPKPRRLFFKPQKSTLDLGAPVLALASGDVDADGTVELVALTTREIVVLALSKDAASVETRIALAGDAAALRPRDAVGALLVADVAGDATPEILAHASDRADGMIVGLKNGALAAQGTLRDYPLFVTPGGAGAGRLATAALGEGVNDFPRESISFAPAWKEWSAAGLPARFLAAEGTSFLAADGTTHNLVGIVDGDGELALHTLPRAAADPWARLADSGSAFEIADLDGDGAPEVITSAYRAPGDGDELVVYTIDDDGSSRVLHRGGALRGGIAAIAAGDFDSDGATDVAALVRLSGAAAGDLWVLR